MSVQPALGDISAADRSAMTAAHVRPLWEFGAAHSAAPPPPRAGFWPWQIMEPLVQRALELTIPDNAERRVLSLIAPEAGTNEFHTIKHLNAGLQILAPGESARPHRHSADALRFILRGRGAITRVDGTEVEMAEGDLVLTPGWCWHEHWHAGSSPIVWLDVLNADAHMNLGTFIFEPGPARPPDAASTASHSPVFRYPITDAREAVDRAPRGSDGIQRARYMNPTNQGPAMALLDCALMRLNGAFGTSVPVRTNAHAVCAVVDGEGETIAGDQRISWKPRDVFSLPANTWVTHKTTTTAHIFVTTDRELYARLGILREELDGTRSSGPT